MTRGPTAIPMLAEMITGLWWRGSGMGSLSSSISRFAIIVGGTSGVVDSSRTMNSSPPSLPTVSFSRRNRCSRCETTARTWSPAACP